MKKRFTIMMDETTIYAIKKLYNFYTPVAVREELERVLWQYATNEINARPRKEYQFDDK